MKIKNYIFLLGQNEINKNLSDDEIITNLREKKRQ